MLFILLHEIQNRCCLIVLGWFSTFIASYLYKEIIVFKLIKPCVSIFKNDSFYFIFTDITEIFSTYMSLCSFLTSQLIMFLVIYHFLLFLAPGFYNSENIFIKTLFLINCLGWFFLTIIVHKIILPLVCRFFFKFQNLQSSQVLSFYFEAKTYEYLNFYINFYAIYFWNFEFLMFLIIILINLIRNLQLLKLFRKTFYFIFGLVATILTPPDVLSQLIVCSTIIILYEIIIFNIILRRISKIQL